MKDSTLRFAIAIGSILGVLVLLYLLIFFTVPEKNIQLVSGIVGAFTASVIPKIVNVVFPSKGDSPAKPNQP